MVGVASLYEHESETWAQVIGYDFEKKGGLEH